MNKLAAFEGDALSQELAPSSALPWEIAVWYHQRTKHHFHRYANALEYLDWATQPDPFRRFAGARLIPLPMPRQERALPFECVYEQGSVEPRPLDLGSLSELFYYALALSAWKQQGGSRWALRVNPSSGNLHPTEGYVVVPPVRGLDGAPGVYHYAPNEHGVEHRGRLNPDLWRQWTAPFGPGAFFVGLSSIPWRESWKYGERAYRYCQHDVGHALAALRLSAGLLGWQLSLLPRVTDAAISRLLGLDRPADFPQHEPEVPDLLAVVSLDRQEREIPASVFFEAAPPSQPLGEWSGQANQLSRAHEMWEVIELVEAACRLEPAATSTALSAALFPARRIPRDAVGDSARAAPCLGTPADRCGQTADFILRTRRSALALDGRTGIAADRFYALLQRLLPSVTALPWDCLPWRPLVHLGLFVHRVDGIVPGLYVLVRDAGAAEGLRSALGASFAWTAPPGCPKQLPLYFLREGDARAVATQLSCHQEIAGAGAFSLGMLAEFAPTLRDHGAHWYRRLFWEAGTIGQVLYLEAEAAGLRSTGIGCFFDDAVHALFGLESMNYQSLYHFTVGGPIDDARLTTLPAYNP